MTAPAPIAWRWRRRYGPDGRQPGAWTYTDGPNRPTLALPGKAEIEPLYAAPSEPEREALLAVEYAANHIEYKDEAGEFIADFVASDFADFLRRWPPYATWRDERLTTGQKSA